MERIIIPYTPRKEQLEIHNAMDIYRFGVVVAHRRLGKTVAAINEIIKKALKCTKTNPHYGYCAPFRNQAESIAWGYLKYFTAPIPNIIRNESKLSVTLPNNAVIRLFGADNADAMRGLYFDGIVPDEVAQFRPDVWPEIIRPTLADRGGWALFIGTPKGVNQFYELYQYAVHADDWYAGCFPADKTDVLPKEELELAKKTMSDSAYRQEFLCDFTAASDDIFITIDIVSAAAKRSYKQHEFYRMPKILAVDPARFGDDKATLIKRQGKQAYDLKKFRNLDLMQLAGIVAKEIDEYKPDAVFVDSVGLGAGVVDRLHQLGYREKVIGVNSGIRCPNGSIYYNKRAEMLGNARDWMIDGGAIPDDLELKQDLVSPTYSYHADNTIKIEKKEDMKSRGLPSPDCGDVLALTFAMPVQAKEDNIIEFLEAKQDEYNPLEYGL